MLNKENALNIANYISAMKSETNLSDSYRRNIVTILSMLSFRISNKLFKSMTRQDVLSYLDSLRKTESIDPFHKWIGTYNLYNTILTKFFRWLYYPDLPPKVRTKPPVVENVFLLKRKEVSIYKPTDLWTEEDDSLFLKYCPSKRIKCYHTISRDSSCRPHEILKLKIKDVVFKFTPDKTKQYAEAVVNGKTGSRNVVLINSIPYIKDYLLNEHPQPGNPNAPFICGLGKSLGRHVGVSLMYTIYVDIYQRDYFPKLLSSPDVLPEDKQKIRELLKKRWNPYIRRHTAITEKALNPRILPTISQHAGWVQGSTMLQRYTHYFGSESSEAILEAYGVISKDKNQLTDILKPKQCPQCNEPNKPDSKFCAKCRMVLTYDAYNETLENQKQKEDKLTTMEERFNSMQSQMQSLISALGSMDQSTKNTFAKQLFVNGVYKNEEPTVKVKVD
jgi:integrase